MPTNTRKLIAIGALALAAAAALILAMSARGHDPGERAFYYDVSSGKLFAAPSGLNSPIRGVDGPDMDAYLAVVYEMGTSAERRIAYLQRPSDQLRQLLEQRSIAEAAGGEIPPQLLDRVFISEQTLVRRLDEEAWHSRTSPAGQQIVMVLSKQAEDGTYPRLSTPD